MKTGAQPGVAYRICLYHIKSTLKAAEPGVQEFKFIPFYIMKSETSLGNMTLSQTNKKPKMG